MKTLCAALLVAALAGAQSVPNTWEVGNMAVPTSTTNLCNEPGPSPACNTNATIHLQAASFVNTNTSGSVTITITDGAGNALFEAAIAGQSGGTTYVVNFKGKAAPGGATWIASASGVTGWIAGN